MMLLYVLWLTLFCLPALTVGQQDNEASKHLSVLSAGPQDDQASKYPSALLAEQQDDKDSEPTPDDSSELTEDDRQFNHGVALFLKYLRMQGSFRNPTDTNTIEGYEFGPDDSGNGDRKKRDISKPDPAEEEGEDPVQLNNLRKFYFVEQDGKVRVKRHYCTRCYRRRRVFIVPVYYARPRCCGGCGGCYGKR